MATVLRPVRRGGFDVREHMRETWRASRASEASSVDESFVEWASRVPEPQVGQLDLDDFPFQLEWYTDEIVNAELVVWRKSSQVGLCLDPATPVLTARLQWVPIGEIRVGERVVAVDEDGPNRRMQTAIVEARHHRRARTLRVTFTDGSSVVCTPEHRWLHRRFESRGWDWRRADELVAGSQIKRLVRPWAASSLDDGWFGGLLDGEGSMSRNRNGAHVVLTQRRHTAVYERALAYLADRGYQLKQSTKLSSAGNVVGMLSMSRMADIFRLIGSTQPTRWRKWYWWQGKKLPATWEDGAAVVERVELMPEQEVVDLTTSRGTFIADGLVSHNSAYAWRFGARQADVFGDTVIYTFPTDVHVRDFGDQRIEPAIEESKYLASRIKPQWVHHKTAKRIGAGWLLLRGSNSRAGAQSAAAQTLIFDERDLLDEGNLEQMMRRVRGARAIGKRPKLRFFGNPTIPGYGIDEQYEASDKRKWLVTCGECGHEQEVTWERNVRWSMPGSRKRWRPGSDDPRVKAGELSREVVERVWRICARCEEPIDVRCGRWQATEESPIIGYHVTQLIVHGADLKALVVASRTSKLTALEAFYNNDLGVAWSPSEASLDQATLLRACERGGERQDAYTGAGAVTMGLDVASERDLNARVDLQLPAEGPGIPNPRQALWIGQLEDFDAVERMMERFRVQVLAVDANPERRAAKALWAKFPGRVVLVEYAPHVRREPPAIKIEWVELPGGARLPYKVSVNRTEAIDAMMESIRDGRNRPLRDPPDGWFEQMRAPKRRTVVSATGQQQPRRVYVSTGPDDYAHADVYALVAKELWVIQMQLQAEAGASGERHLPDQEFGFRRVQLATDEVVDDYDPALRGMGGM